MSQASDAARGVVAVQHAFRSGFSKHGLRRVQEFRQRFFFGTGCDEQAVLSGLDFVIDEVVSRRNKGYPTRVVNLSLGSTPANTGECSAENPATRSAVDTLNALGVVVVASAGNSGSSDRISEPACIGPVVSVGSVNRNDIASDFSNVAPELDLFAFGESVLAAHNPFGIDAALGTNTGLDEDPSENARTVTGTSIAAPQVAGAIASLASASPGRSAAQLARLVRTSRVRIDVRRPNAPVRTFPRLDLLSAYQQSQNALRVNLDTEKGDQFHKRKGSDFAGGGSGPRRP